MKIDLHDNLRGDSSTKGWILEHRYVMARHLGRPLARHEHVHHINGDRADNRLDNLELWAHPVRKQQPSGQREDDLIEYVTAHSLDRLLARLATMGYVVTKS